MRDQLAILEEPFLPSDRVDPVLADVEDYPAAVKRVLGSASFAKANRLHAFLEYVCRLTLAGREGEINELNIGINVFERRENYNASDDTIVRTTARLLRQRLQSYYETEGQCDSIRIDIPRGAYIPRFHKVVPPSQTNPAALLPQPVPLEYSPAPKPVDGPHKLLWSALVVASALLGAGVTFAWITPHHFPPWGRTPSDRLWSQLFTKDRATVVVPADTTLLHYEMLTHRLVPLDEYIGGNFIRPSDAAVPGLTEILSDYRDKRYTAVTSVGMVAELSRISYGLSNGIQVRFARDLQPADFNQSNAVLIGAEQNDPWVQLFRKELRFHIDWSAPEDRWHILNDHPGAGEPAEWPLMKGDPSRTNYSQIALVRNLSGNGYVLILAGTSMFATQAASDFLFNAQKMDPILSKVPRKNGTLGTFEVLLQSNIVGIGTINTHVAALRFQQ